MKLYLNMEPPRCTAQHKGERIVAGRYVQHYEKRAQRNARLAYLAAIRRACANAVRDYERMDEDGNPLPISVRIDFVFRAPRKKDAGRPKLTRPDLDNMAKGLLDCLQQAELIVDDAQIAHLDLRKGYALRPHVFVTIEQISCELPSTGL